jgi:hypothetical protein
MNSIYWLFGYETKDKKIKPVLQEHQVLMNSLTTEIVMFDKKKLNSKKRLERNVFNDILQFDKKRLKHIQIITDEPQDGDIVDLSSSDSDFTDGNEISYIYDWQIYPHVMGSGYIVNEFIRDVCLF